MNRKCIQFLSRLFSLIILSTICCTQPPPSEKGTVETAQIDNAEPESISKDKQSITEDFKPPRHLLVSEWVDKRFVLLKKTKMFQKFGYLLYLSPELEKSKEPISTSIQLQNHRLKYTTFAGTYVTVTKLEQRSDSEYLVTFQTDTLSLIVYGKTSKGIIEGIACEDDLVAAQQRWEGATIFSRRRSIEIYDSTKSKFENTKVSILEPLRIVDIRWGRTPLPTKPIWLMVKRSNTGSAIIPIHYSWTNVPLEKQGEGLPWEEEIIEMDPQKTYKWDKLFWEAIDNHKLLTGMNMQQAELSWGKPEEKKQDWKDDTVKVDIWLYSGNRLVFHNDSLVLSEVRFE